MLPWLFIFSVERQTIFLSSDDECKTKKGVPEKKAEVIIPHESQMKTNISVNPVSVPKMAIDTAMILDSTKDIEINQDFKSMKLQKSKFCSEDYSRARFRSRELA
jgi:hypothetical protein